MTIIHDPKCLGYHAPGHPELPARISTVADLLRNRGFTFVKPDPCGVPDILRVHDETLVNAVKNGSFLDMDTPAIPGMLDFALHAAGAAVTACKTAAAGDNAFSLMRPPGHHATRRHAMGFCYFNNLAVAVANHLSSRPDAKIAILDIDCHHGNGTEDIFLGYRSVMFVSLHQAPLYPGTGLASKDNCWNYPLPPGTDEKKYLSTFENACSAVAEFNPDLIGVSAGFDTYKHDPLTQFGLEIGTYAEIAKAISGLRRPVFAVLEGGYSTDLPQCVHAFIKNLT